jgi:tetratricopeptide (TPR) repeat protein
LHFIASFFFFYGCPVLIPTFYFRPPIFSLPPYHSFLAKSPILRYYKQHLIAFYFFKRNNCLYGWRIFMVRTTYWILCVIVLGICGCGFHSGPGAAQRGNEAFKEGRFDKAVEELTYATSRIANSPELYYNLGVSHMELGNCLQAQDAMQAALNLNPAYSAAHACLGQLYFQQDNLPKAIESLEKALSLETTADAKSRILNTMGLVEARRKHEGLARLHFLRALKENRKSAFAYYNLASLYRDDYRLYEESLDSFEIFVRLVDPKSSYYLKAKDNIKRLKNNLERTRANEPDAARRDSPKASKLLQEGVTAYSLKQHAKAIKAYKESLEADPLTFSAAYGLGIIYQQQGNKIEARNAFKRASLINPGNQDCYYRAAVLSIQLNQTAEGTKILDKAIARSPFNPASAKLMATIKYAEGHYPEARLYGEFYLALAPLTETGRKEYQKWVQMLPRK